MPSIIYFVSAHEPIPGESISEPVTFFSAGGWIVLLFAVYVISLYLRQKYVLQKAKEGKKKAALPPLLYREDVRTTTARLNVLAKELLSDGKKFVLRALPIILEMIVGKKIARKIVKKDIKAHKKF